MTGCAPFSSDTLDGDNCPIMLDQITTLSPDYCSHHKHGLKLKVTTQEEYM